VIGNHNNSAPVIQHMNLRRDRGFYCDCTVGGAGHLLAMLEATQKANFIGIDWDPDAIAGDICKSHW